MSNYKLTLEYDGSRYAGWQRLKDTDNTIQQKLENVLSEMAGRKIEIIGSGRTDKGTHAYNQIASFKLPGKETGSYILEYMNRYLPEDIVVKKVEKVDERFHARFHVKGKKYLYRVWNHYTPTVFDRKYCYHFPDRLDLAAMREAAALLIGEHDFRGFSSEKKSEKNTVRTLYSIDIEQDGKFVHILYHGDGFLYNMARILTGTLLDIGTGKKNSKDISRILAEKDRELAGPTVPAGGLFLYEVEY